MNKNVKTGILGLLLVIPSFLILFAVVIVPIFLAFVESFKNDSGGYDLSHYIYIFTDKVMRSNVIYTLKITVISVILVLASSYALAVYMRFSSGVMAGWIKRTYMIPMFIPGVIATYGLINMYGNHGWLSSFLLLFTDAPLPRIIYDARGIILANMWFNIPFTTMLLSSALSGINNSVIESAKDVGAGRLAIFFRVILPLSYKTLLVALTFVFMGVIGSFTAPFLIGPNAPQMLGVAMEQIFGVYQEEELASAVAVFMFLLCSVMGYFYIRTMIKEDKASRSS
ncbi:ABC transporter permease [Paenibacillus sp. sptzw28]|uniref:ABC transporter permease n=1 Tax=Paenibacillus sp. sptzw28 TaxID=715179 RepID=UPI001C6DF153|nr:ABC transporter permease [Paenibacillus sp. sptzw28]QYR19079.1 ABC transporter permease [Paenibacillus sp. sptzw28]